MFHARSEWLGNRSHQADFKRAATATLPSANSWPAPTIESRWRISPTATRLLRRRFAGSLARFFHRGLPRPYRRSELQRGEFDLSLYELAQATDIRPLVIETVLTHLELGGIIRPLGSFYAGSQFRLLEPESALLGRHTPERQAFLRRLLHCGKRGTKWSTIDPDSAALELAEPRDRIVKTLGWLSDAGSIELKPSGSRERPGRRAAFGLLASVPFAAVLARMLVALAASPGPHRFSAAKNGDAVAEAGDTDAAVAAG